MPKRAVFKNTEGGVSVIVPAWACGLTIEQIAEKDVPKGVPYKIIDTTDLPSDRVFRNAWETDPNKYGESGVKHVNIHVGKAKEIGHNIRREKRAEEFAPLDPLASIPGAKGLAAEAARQAIRDKYDAIQVQIDAATTPEEIKAALGI